TGQARPRRHRRAARGRSMRTSAIRAVRARQVLDSRGRPTVEVDVTLADGAVGCASVPAGASTGTHEAHELRDGDPADYDGYGVRTAVRHVHAEIAPALAGMDAREQRRLDQRLRELDGTERLARLGANAVLGVSLAACRAAAASAGEPLYARIAALAGVRDICLPMPMVNTLMGGLHAGRRMDVQAFLALPAAARSLEEAIRLSARVRASAARVMAARGMSTLLADEGGLSPGFASAREALALMVEAIEAAGLAPGVDV